MIRIDAFVDVGLEEGQGPGGIFRLHVSPGFGVDMSISRGKLLAQNEHIVKVYHELTQFLRDD